MEMLGAKVARIINGSLRVLGGNSLLSKWKCKTKTIIKYNEFKRRKEKSPFCVSLASCFTWGYNGSASMRLYEYNFSALLPATRKQTSG